MSFRYFTSRLAKFARISLARLFDLHRISHAAKFKPIVPRIKALRISDTLRVRRLPVRLFGPRFWQQLRLSGRVQARAAGVITSWLRYSRPYSAYLAFTGVGLVTPIKDTHIMDFIKDMFERQSKIREAKDSYPTSLDGYDIGDPVGQGCNAVVYSARVKSEGTSSGPFNSRLPSTSSLSPLKVSGAFPLAIKMLFNYEAGSNTNFIWKVFSREVVPCTEPKIKNLMKWDSVISRKHQNIVLIHTAFVDKIRLWPELTRISPSALPMDLYPEGMGWNQTLFVVMKRYKMTLRQYLLTFEFGTRTGQVLFGQLLEAIRFLVEEGIAHRDLKSNNILVEFDRDDEIPQLAVSDFGCCLANGTMKLPYFDVETDLGGNQALRPPEISCAKPGLLKRLDFSKADLWAAGAIGYEIFIRVNPFYKDLQSRTYEDLNLPALPADVPFPVQAVIERILRRNPVLRPTAECAANIVALSLFNVEFLSDVLLRRISPQTADFKLKYMSHDDGVAKLLGVKKSEKGETVKVNQTVDHTWVQFCEAMCLYSAETLLGNACKTLSKAEVYLRQSFLRRVSEISFYEVTDYFSCPRNLQNV